MKEALFHLDQIEGIGLQAQLREMLVSAILSRRLLPGESIPSTRAMASQLGVSRNTVTLAYQALLSDGYIESRDRSGFFVSKDAPAAAPSTQRLAQDDSTIDWAGKLRTRFSDIRRVDKPLNWREFEYPFIFGQADSTLFNHSDWRDCARQALGLRNFEALAGDHGSADDPLLIDYIRARTLPRRGVLAEPGDVLVTLGAQNALYLIAQLLCTNGVKVAIEDPGYPDLRDTLIRLGADITLIPVDQDGMAVDERLANVDVVFVTPSHHAPTTSTMPMERRRALLKAAEEHDFLIVEDDYDFELGFLSKPLPALRSLDSSGRVLYIGSFSKSLFPGLRLGYLVAPAPFIAEARALRFLMLRHPPGHAQRTAAYFLALGHHDSFLKRLRTALATRREALEEALQSCGLTEASTPKFGGASFWLAAPEGTDTAELAIRLRKSGVLIEAGAPFFAEPPLAEAPHPTNFFRIGYSAISSEKIAPGIKVLAKELRLRA